MYTSNAVTLPKDTHSVKPIGGKAPPTAVTSDGSTAVPSDAFCDQTQEIRSAEGPQEALLLGLQGSSRAADRLKSCPFVPGHLGTYVVAQTQRGWIVWFVSLIIRDPLSCGESVGNHT